MANSPHQKRIDPEPQDFELWMSPKILIRDDKRGAIPSHLAPIFERIGVNGEAWCDLVQRFSKHFKRAAGSRDLVAAEAARRNQTSLQAPGVAILT